MKKKILYELFNLTVTGGTGIATYARNLIGAARALGFTTDGLLHSQRAIDTKDPLLGEIGFFDARNRKPSAFTRYVTLNWRRGVGAPFGLKTTQLNRSAIVLSNPSTAPFAGLDSIHVAPLFMDLARFHFKRFGAPARLRLARAPDIFHATQAIPLRVAGARNIYTVHDIVPLRLPDSTLDDKKFFLNMVRNLGRTADLIVTVSEASRDDLIHFCGVPADKIVNTYQSVSFPDELLSQTDEEAARLVKGSFDLDKDGYYLFYGALEPKKNVGRLIDAYLASGSARKLVIAGGLGWEYEQDLAKIDASKTNALKILHGRIAPDERIRHLRHLPLFQLTALIRCARAVVFPSLYEGFGLPVLESMLLRTPVITSDGSSLKEVAGKAALLVDPVDTRSIMAAMQKVDADDALCRVLSDGGPTQASRFSPSAYRERLSHAYGRVLNGVGRDAN